MALTAFLRRTLIALFAIMTFVLMVFYWNQDALKPSSYLSTFDRLVRTNFVSEKTWTYKCVNDRCVRQHYLTEHHRERRVPFLTCSMTCGAPNIWPEPTGKVTLGSKSLTFATAHVKANVETPFEKVESLFRDAFLVFMDDLRLIESIAKEEKHEGENQAAAEGGDGATSVPKHPDDTLCRPDRPCELDLVEVTVKISKYPDVALRVDTDESYNITVKSDGRKTSVRIHAKGFFGARNALTTLQQMIWYDDEDKLLRIIGRAYVEDAPKFGYRGLMLDTSRHYFSVEAIKRTLSGMALSKLNRFHWHMTDSQSFPFVSRHYPQLAIHGAYSNHEVYTTEDVRDIVEFARVRGIQVIPEIDAPAHAGNGWDWGPKHGMGELSLCINQQPWSFYCGEPPCGQLNPKNNNTYLVLQRLYAELLELTGPTDFFHLGGDEVNLDCWAQFFNDTDLRGLWCEFMLQAFQRLRQAHGGTAPKVTVVWSSGLTSTPCLSKNSFAVQVWGGSTWQENFDLIENGFNLIISHVDAWYLDCGFGSWRSTGEGACSPYRTWQNVYKHRPWNRMRLTPVQMKQILGGEVCLWTEQVDESTLDSRVWPRAAALAERLWTDPDDEHDFDAVHKDVFSRFSVFRNRLVQLGIKAEAIFPKYCAQNQDECV
ncbi:probable beta-hexosaminidase fdl isoform X2 [Phlebotomus argentipes]|uniref:probable beta-hexosaminidase fdl isoform X2 n=1 Tax=Phlebotomus argentipes TaxID=94469 RepID=UPI00289301FB|nr:probable beta-hexosaminidase fdl isoform X2 [Phlebotomus argentipes]